MEQLSVGLAAWGYGLASIVFAGFTLQLRLGWRRGQHGFALMLAVGLSAFWALSNAVVALVPNLWTIAVAGMLDSFRIVAWLAFLLSIIVPNELEAKAPHQKRSLSIEALALIGIAFVSALVHIALALGLQILNVGPRLTLLISLFVAVLGLVTVEQVARNVPEHVRWGVKPLCLGLGGMFAFDLYIFADGFLFGRLDWDLWVARGIVDALVIPFVAVSAARNRDWSIDIHMSRQVVFRSTALLCSGAYLLIVAAAGYYVRYFGGSWGRALQVAFLFTAVLFLVVLVLSGTLRSRLRVFVSKHFFSYQYDYREEWLRFTQALANHDHDPSKSIRELSVKALADLVESPGGALWLKTEASGYRPVARWNMPSFEAVEPTDGSLADFLRRRGWVISLDEYRVSNSYYEGLRLPDWLLEGSRAWLVLPLISGRDLVGFVVLARSRAKIELNWEVNDLLKTAGRQAATFLAQMQATEALLEAKKFESFNRLSAFVVHDVKNLVAQMSLLLKNAERHGHNPEFQKDMLATVENVVERMNRLLMQLRAGVTPIDPPRPVDLAVVVQNIKRSKHTQHPALVIQAEQGVHALGHFERLERVIGHLVQNAMDATEEGDDVRIRVAGNGNEALVEVTDRGHGMSPDFVRDRLFKPFQTTKPSGMGIGAFESEQYVKELGGRIEVCSRVNVGTQVTVWLPRARSGSASQTEERVVA